MNAALRNVLAFTVALIPLASFAAEISEPEAKRIEGAISSSLPAAMRQTGVVRVAPLTDHFNVTLDLAGMLAKSTAPWTVKEVTPIVHALTPGADGLWDFSTQGAFKLATELLAANRTSAFQLSVGELQDTGKFDPSISFIREADISMKDVTSTMRSSQDTIKAGIKDFSAKIRSTDVKAGVLDVVSDYTGSGLAQTFGTFPNPEVKISGETLDGQLSAKSFDVAGIAKLMAFWRAEGRQQDIKSLKPEELKELSSIVGMHKPFVDGFGGQTTISGVRINSAGKAFMVEKLAYDWSFEDMAKDGAVVFGATAYNPSVTPGFWPAGLEKALPKEMAIHARYFGFKFEPVWEALSKPDMATRDTEIRKVMLPDGRVTMQFSNTYARSDVYDLSLEGSLFMRPGRDDDQSEADLTITAKDFDKTVKFLQDNSKTVPIFGQASFFALMAKGLGKTQPDGSMLWNVKVDERGKITINGQPLPV
jgi:hypothetical protein